MLVAMQIVSICFTNEIHTAPLPPPPVLRFEMVSIISEQNGSRDVPRLLERVLSHAVSFLSSFLRSCLPSEHRGHSGNGKLSWILISFTPKKAPLWPCNSLPMRWQRRCRIGQRTSDSFTRTHAHTHTHTSHTRVPGAVALSRFSSLNRS